MSRAPAIARFLAKCRAKGSCIIWTGATYRSGPKRSPGFWHDGRRVPARRWYAKHVKGCDVGDNDDVLQACDDELCVRHSKVDKHGLGRNIIRQNYLLNSLFPKAD